MPIELSPRLPQRKLIPAIGALTSLGAPLTLLAARSWQAGVQRSFSWMLDDLRTSGLSYGALALGSLLTFVTLGYFLGRQLDGLRDSSLVDALTGLANRRHLEAQLRLELGRARRHRLPLALLFIDVDGFKAVNDRSGHHVGDLALQSVARAIRSGLRESDFAARLGGDEFTVVCPHTSPEDAVALAERIRERVAGCLVPAGLTVSIGVAGFRAAKIADEALLLAAADQALYRAKAKGRNRVAISRPTKLRLIQSA